MEDNSGQKYISLAQAAMMCPYSEPYLRLRSRQGKLKSIKLGKKWMTTAAWVDDYGARVKKWNDAMEQKKKVPAAVMAAVAPPEDPKIEIPRPPIETPPAAAPDYGAPPRANFASFGYNPYFFRWGVQKNQNGLSNKAAFREVSIKKIAPLAAGQIIPPPQARAVNADFETDRWAAAGAILSGVVCSLALFLAVSGGDFGMQDHVRYGQAGISDALLSDDGSGDFAAAVGASGLVLRGGGENTGALEKFVDWIKQFAGDLN